MKKINKKQRRTFDAISNSDHITLRRRRHALHDLHSHFDSCFFNSAGFEKIRTGWQGWDDVPTPISGNQLGHSRRSLTDKPKRHFCVCVRRKHTTTAANVGFESWNGNVKLECWTGHGLREIHKWKFSLYTKAGRSSLDLDFLYTGLMLARVEIFVSRRV